MTDIQTSRERSAKWYRDFGHLPEVKDRRRITLLKWRAANPERYLYQRAKDRAKLLVIPFGLTPEDIIIPDKCPALNTSFEYGTPYAASLDRIIPELGYIKGNVQVISWKANLMKQNATKEELDNFAKWILKT